jgi:NitT/TauT family transport system substrate-binding protein
VRHRIDYRAEWPHAPIVSRRWQFGVLIMNLNTRKLWSRRRALKALAAGIPAAVYLGRSYPARADSTIRVGTIKTPHWAASWLLPDYAKSVQVRLVEFKTSLEMISALTAGNLDIGTVGYWHLIRMLDQGANVQAVAGLCSGGTRLVVRKGLAVKSWADLKGKTCAVARGATQDIQFLMALKKNGLTTADITYRDLGGNAAVQVSALQQGQIDAASMWEPFASQVIQQNIAEGFSTLYADSFRVNGLMIAPTDYVKANHDIVQATVDAHIKATDHLLKSPDDFLELAIKLSGFPRETMIKANENSILEYALHLDDARKLAGAVHEIGYIKTDVRAKLDSALDYSFLMQSTGKSSKELGA